MKRKEEWKETDEKIVSVELLKMIKVIAFNMGKYLHNDMESQTGEC